MKPPPTSLEWKALVAKYGYCRAVKIADCDLDDIPGIEETWIENMERQKDRFDRHHKRFFRWLDQRRG